MRKIQLAARNIWVSGLSASNLRRSTCSCSRPRVLSAALALRSAALRASQLRTRCRSFIPLFSSPSTLAQAPEQILPSVVCHPAACTVSTQQSRRHGGLSWTFAQVAHANLRVVGAIVVGLVAVGQGAWPFFSFYSPPVYASSGVNATGLGALRSQWREHAAHSEWHRGGF